jgi:tRNA-dihydrouridine synthase B
MQTPLRPIHIRTLQIDPPLLLAPMAGLTHTGLRQILSGFGGVGLLSTEMLSAKRLPTENPAMSPYLIRTSAEQPLSYQLLTSHAGEVGRAIEMLHRFKADAIDLNMGCPAAAVGKFGAGISLMELPDEVRGIVSEARKRTSLPLTAKIRLGKELDERKLLDFCVMLQDEGIDMISVHARLKHESFAREPRWEWVAKVKERVAIPVIANGGIFSVADAKDCLAASGADGLMLGRGAVTRPWLFAGVARELCGRDIAAPTVSLPAVYARFIDLLAAHFKPEHRLGRLKEFTHYFARNYQFGHHLAIKVQTSQSVEEAWERAERFFEQAHSGAGLGSSGYSLTYQAEESGQA